jgi:long-chain acyl-CoA synthetase
VYGSSLAGLLDGPARHAAAAPALLVGERVERTWAGLAEAVARRAGGLRERHGIGPGDAVALYAANHSAYLEALFAIWHAGAVAVPISSRLHAREAADIVDRSHALLCFATDDVAAALGREPLAVPMLVFGEDEESGLAAFEPVAATPRLSTDDAWIFFTSGTTGKPKGARLSHGNLWAMAAAFMADSMAIDSQDSIVHVAALSHASGLMALPFVSRAAAQVLPESGGFDADELLALIAAGSRSSFFVPPTLLRRLCAHPLAGSGVGEAIGTILVGAAPVAPAELRDGVEAFGPCLWNGYGQGETPCTITANGKRAIGDAVAAGDEDALRSVGVARVGLSVRTLGEDGVEVAPGEVGEVCVDGPTVMAGYLDMPEASAEALRGGWLHTGDLGRFDEQGRLTLVDRAKDVIITGGYNVYPREVEDVLDLDPAVAEVAVVGVADPEWGERIVAFVVPAPEATIDRERLDRSCLEAIARHKRPKQYHEVGALPRNAAGKVLKSTLREQAVGSADGRG